MRTRMVGQASADLLRAIVDVAKSLIRGEVPLTGAQLTAAKRIKRDLLKLAQPRTNLRATRSLLEQKGNLIGVVSGPLLKGLATVAGPLIGSVLSGFTGK